MPNEKWKKVERWRWEVLQESDTKCCKMTEMFPSRTHGQCLKWNLLAEQLQLCIISQLPPHSRFWNIIDMKLYYYDWRHSTVFGYFGCVFRKCLCVLIKLKGMLLNRNNISTEQFQSVVWRFSWTDVRFLPWIIILNPQPPLSHTSPCIHKKEVQKSRVQNRTE